MQISALLRSTISIRTVLLAATQAVSGSEGTCGAKSFSTSSESCAPSVKMAQNQEKWKSATSVYDFHATDIDGNDVALEKYRGQILIIVNVACKCGFTNDHYRDLVQLHEKYRAQGLSILGFPSNQFAGQEPGSPEEIKDFVKQKGVDFDMFDKVEVNGGGAHPLWKYLKEKQGGTLFDAIKWNFTKFVIDRSGQPVARYGGTTAAKELEKDIQKLL